MLVGLARCSTEGQDHALQVDALTKAGAERIYQETASGTSDHRVGLKQLLADLREGDVVIVYSLSRLARSTRQLLDLSDEFRRRGIGLRSITEAIDTSTPQGRFFFVIMAAIAELEASILRERTRAGLAAARARGRTGGRPRALVGQKVEVARTLLSTGEMTVQEIARQIGVAPGTIYRTFPGGRSGLRDSG
jgi:DNA invertase Pin-like site-specific DNA recombinase